MNEYRLRQKHKKSSLEVEQWTVYSIADLIVATIIVVVAMCNAEPPRFRHFQRQVVQTHPSPAAAAPPAPYAPAGYRPSGAQFNLPQKAYGAPAQGYGPPEDQQPQGTTTELPETTTTVDEEVTTVEPQAENIKELKDLNDQKRPVFLVVPRANQQQLRSQSYVSYVQEYPQVARVEVEVGAEPEEVVYQPHAALYSGKLQTVQTLPLNVYNPYAYYQIYQ